MRPTSTLVHLAVCLASLTPLTAAWPGFLPEADSLVVRADKTTAEAKQTATAADSTETEAPKSTKGEGKQVTTRNLNTAKVETETGTETGTGKKAKETGTATKKKGSKETHETFAPNDPAGGVSMQTPATTLQATPLFKIGDFVTFGWNYTSLQGTPTAIDVLVSCSSAAETWTLTSNMTFATDVNFLWDTKKQAEDPEAPLGVNMYTLIIKDSDSGITDIPDPGYLGAYAGFQFGMYTPQSYTPLSDWTCAACNAAPGLDHHAIGFALTMSAVTILSFTWFVTGLGLH
ncbi:Fc.00g076030.m01.CDS01 [Cosmosporella sp. VM-42]